MRSRFMPAALVIMALLIDTSVVPFVLANPFIVSLTLVTVLELAIYLGRMHGMLYGTLGGLLLDILVGYPLGFNTFRFIILGFLAGTVAYEPVEERTRKAASRLYLRRALTLFAAVLASEIVVYAYQYFNTALLNGVYFRNIGIRTALSTALGMLLGPIDARLILGKPKPYQRTSAKREVKSF